MALISINKKGYYTNSDAVNNLADYVFNPNKTPQQYYCMCGIPFVPDVNNHIDTSFIVNSFQYTKNNYHQTDGRKAYHFCFCLSPFEFKKIKNLTLELIMQDFCSYIYNSGYQVFAAIHETDDNGNPATPHIHVVFNSVNFLDGTKYRINLLNDMITFSLQKIERYYGIHFPDNYKKMQNRS